jgi:hypothetical protein
MTFLDVQYVTPLTWTECRLNRIQRAFLERNGSRKDYHMLNMTLNQRR